MAIIFLVAHCPLSPFVLDVAIENKVLNVTSTAMYRYILYVIKMI